MGLCYALGRIITSHASSTLDIYRGGGREDWGGPFSSPISPQDVLRGVGGHRELGEGQATGVELWEESAVIVSWEGKRGL